MSLEFVFEDKKPILKLHKNLLVNLVPLPFCTCPTCGTKLTDGFEIREDILNCSEISTKGKICFKCEYFYSSEISLFKFLRSVPHLNFNLKDTYIKGCDFRKYNSLFKNIGSAYKQIWACSKDSIRVYTLVYNHDDVDSYNNVIYYLDNIGMELHNMSTDDNSSITIDDDDFYIVNTSEKLLDYNLKRRIDKKINQYIKDKTNKEISTEQTLYIYEGNIDCKRYHRVKDYRANIDLLKHDGIDFYIEYCEDCQKFLMKYTDYKNHLDRYGYIPMKLRMFNQHINRYNTYNRAEKSPLMLYGYSVSEQEGYSSKGRQKILSNIMDYGWMTKSQIRDYLQYFIDTNGRRYNMERAVAKWEEDKKFVLNYQLSEHPQVKIGNIEKLY